MNCYTCKGKIEYLDHGNGSMSIIKGCGCTIGEIYKPLAPSTNKRKYWGLPSGGDDLMISKGGDDIIVSADDPGTEKNIRETLEFLKEMDKARQISKQEDQIRDLKRSLMLAELEQSLKDCE